MTITEVVLDAAEIRRMIENAEHSKASALSRWDRKIRRLQAILDHADDQDQVRVSYRFHVVCAKIDASPGTEERSNDHD